ncbi:MAG: NAD(P)H-hydrate epimerase [Chloroflexi bacterium]|nr:NAD(P)H-hydrate epimerase [Chloroflexota bacterium]
MSSDSGGRNIPFLTTGQMREVDRAMIEDYEILLIQMMENAGRNLAQLARRRFLSGNPTGRRVLVLAGTGGNGGGGLVCARRLHNWGAYVDVLVTSEPAQFSEIPHHQLTILQHMDVSVGVAGETVELPSADLIIDAIIGYSLHGAPTGPAASLIRAANAHGAPILALDVPSGVDTTSGSAFEPAIHATATLTLALPKEGLHVEAAKVLVGELYLGDIGVPKELYASPPLNIDLGPVFAEDDIIRVW